MENNAKGLLVLIVPVALALAALTTPWTIFVVAIALAVGRKLWQDYRGQQLMEVIEPDFRQLIETHQGKVTVADLAQKTGLSGSMIRWYLNRKAKEYGTRAMIYQDKGVIYHFLTVGSLGNMFDDSDRPLEVEVQAAQNPPSRPIPQQHPWHNPC